MHSSGSAGRAAVVALLLLTGLALFARLLGAGAGLPHLPEPDNAYFLQPSLIEDGSAESRAHDDYTKYPHLVSRVLMVLPEDPWFGPVKEHLTEASEPSLRPRILIALAGAACVPATYLLASRFLAAGWALFASALVATSVLHALFSSQGRPHVLVALFITLTIWASLRVLRRGSWLDYLIAGSFAALALGSLHNGVAALLPLCAAHFLRARGKGFSAQLRLALPALLVAASALLFLPFLFLAARTDPAGVGLAESAVKLGCHQFHLDKLHGKGFLVIGWTLWSYEPVLLVLLALSVPLVVARAFRWREFASETRLSALVVASFVVPYLAAIGIYDASYERFVIPLLPCLALVAAWGSSTLLARMRASKAACNSFALVALAWPAFASAKLAHLLVAPDTASLAAKWLAENADVRTERVLMTPRLDLPLARDADLPAPFSAEELRVGAWVYPWTYYQLWLEPLLRPGPGWNIGWLPTLDPQFARDLQADPAETLSSLDWTLIVEGSYADSSTIPGNQQRIADALGVVAEPVASFAASTVDGEPRALWWQETSAVESPFWSRLLRATSFGPSIRIHRRR